MQMLSVIQCNRCVFWAWCVQTQLAAAVAEASLHRQENYLDVLLVQPSIQNILSCTALY